MSAPSDAPVGTGAVGRGAQTRAEAVATLDGALRRKEATLIHMFYDHEDGRNATCLMWAGSSIQYRIPDLIAAFEWQMRGRVD